MELNQLKCFLEVALNGSITRTAEELFMTQPSLSKVISRLESELGIALFDRVNGRVTLNSNGILFQKYVSIALKSLDQGIAVVKSNAEAEKNKIRIAYPGALVHIDDIVEECQTHFPNILLSASSIADADILRMRDNGEIDIGFFTCEPNFIAPDVEYISKQRWVVMLNKDHPLAHAPEIKIKHFENEIICLTETQKDRSFIYANFEASGIHRDFLEQTDKKEYSRMINCGYAIAIASDYVYYHRVKTAPNLPLCHLRLEAPEWVQGVYLARNSAFSQGETFNQVYDYLKQRIIEKYHIMHQQLGFEQV